MRHGHRRPSANPASSRGSPGSSRPQATGRRPHGWPRSNVTRRRGRVRTPSAGPTYDRVYKGYWSLMQDLHAPEREGRVAHAHGLDGRPGPRAHRTRRPRDRQARRASPRSTSGSRPPAGTSRRRSRRRRPSGSRCGRSTSRSGRGWSAARRPTSRLCACSTCGPRTTRARSSRPTSTSPSTTSPGCRRCWRTRPTSGGPPTRTRSSTSSARRPSWPSCRTTRASGSARSQAVR